ncbi:NADPH:adrenodoxin oxidoreductase, mitochondrial [Abortiporus biennis]
MAPIKLAIIGGGPSSFYVASRLLSLLPASNPYHSSLKIHMYDRLWAPHGLVRYGVAPDHPEVKNCTHKFNEAASDPRLSFFGNVNVSSSPSVSPIPHAVPLSLSSLFPHYTHLLLSSGCTIPNYHPALPPSSHCIPALSMVHWYTQHPAVAHKPPPPLEKIEHVSLIGQGNVSLDVARMLLTPPSTLEKYDVPESVLEVLRRSAVQHVSIIGRRGPLEAAFTTKELREMMNLEDSYMVPVDPCLMVPNAGEKLTRQQSRTLQLLQKGSKNKPGSTPKSWSLEFFKSPTGLAVPSSELESSSSSRPLTLSLANNTLNEARKAIPTGETSTLDTSFVVTSLGHHADPSTPWFEPALGHVRTVGGRVVNEHGQTVKNVYSSGWASMGARGVLASTMMDAYAVADTILADSFPGEFRKEEDDADTKVAESEQRDNVAQGVLPSEVDWESLPEEVVKARKGGLVTDYQNWRLIDAEEIRRGEVKGKERERMSWEEAKVFLDVAKRT